MNREIVQILLIEDNLTDYILLREVLSSDPFADYQITHVERLKDGIDLFAKRSFGLVLLDLGLPDSQGLDTFRRIAKVADEAPIVVLSGLMDEQVAIQAVQAGAQDYLVKGQSDWTLVTRAVRYAIERQQNRAALHASERRFRALIEHSADAIALLDADGVILYGSPASARILGYPLETFIGSRMTSYTHPDDSALNRGFYQQILEQAHQPVTCELRYRHQQGAWRWVDVTGTNLLNEPSVQAIVLNYRDITARKQAEEALRQSLNEAEALYTVSSLVRTAQTIDEALQVILDQTLAALNAQEGAIWLYRPVHKDLFLEAARGWFEQIHEKSYLPGQDILGQVFTTGKIYQSHQLVQDLSAELVQGRPLFSENAIGVPIRAAQEITGVLLISFRNLPEVHAEKLKLLGSFAEMAGVTLNRIRMNEDILRHMKRLEALRSIDQLIASGLDQGHILENTLAHILAQLQVDAACVLLLDPQTQRLYYAAGRGFWSSGIENAQLRLGEGCGGKVAQNSQVVTIDIPLDHCESSRFTQLAAERFVSYYGLPLISKGSVKGVLELFQRSRLTPNAEWKHFSETLAGQLAIAIDNTQLFENLQQANFALRVAYDATIEGWSHALDLRDKETEGHTLRVTEMTIKLAQQMGFAESELLYVRWGALLHDIGKMGIPDDILLKPGPLTTQEWEIMRRHPQYAYDLLSPIQYLGPALDIPYGHHEKWNGLGYPRHLKGEEIPLTARIFTVVDVWDAVLSDRPYRPAWTNQRAMEYIVSERAVSFDPQIVDAFLNFVEQENLI